MRIKLNGLDASAYDHLELRVKGDPSAGFAPAFQVGFERPSPGRPNMIESGSSVVTGVSDQWRDVQVPLTLMIGLGDRTGLDEFVLTFESRPTDALAGAIDVDDLALVRTGRPGPSASDPVPTPKKDAWEQANGGKDAARAAVAGRLTGWPEALTRPAPQAADDAGFLIQLARDSWRGLAALTDREHGLPVDHVSFAAGGVEPAQARVGDYTSPSTIGIWLMAVVGAEKLGLIGRPEAQALLDHALTTLGKLERLHGFFYNYYDTTSLERSSNFVSSVDSSWLTAGLMVLRQAHPELAAPATRLIQDGDYGWLYDPAVGLISHGYYVNLDCPSQYHYGLLYTEARVLSLIAIGKGDVPEAHWFKLMRTLPASETWQTQPPRNRVARQVRGQEVIGGWYERDGYRYLPSWGGSMFEALMPTLVIDEASFAPESLGRNDRGPCHAAASARAGGAGLSGLGHVAERHRRGRRLRRVRRPLSGRARLSGRRGGTLCLGAGARGHPRTGDPEPARARGALPCPLWRLGFLRRGRPEDRRGRAPLPDPRSGHVVHRARELPGRSGRGARLRGRSDRGESPADPGRRAFLRLIAGAQGRNLNGWRARPGRGPEQPRARAPGRDAALIQTIEIRDQKGRAASRAAAPGS